MEITARHYIPEIDDKYVYSTWFKSEFYGRKHESGISRRQLSKFTQAQINDWIKESQILVASLKDDYNTIFGYIAIKDGKIIKICIKRDFLESEVNHLLLESIKGKIDE